MISISLCMIVKDEEEVVGRCLECVKDIVDEIIIVDTGSTDATIEIAKMYTSKIYNFTWIDDFSAARNFSFSKATKDYIIWLDADDIIDQINRKKLINLKNNLEPSVDVIMMKYDVAFDENNTPTFSYYRERIFKREKKFRWIGEIHEVIIPSGEIINKEISISHKKTKVNEPKRNLKIFEKIIADGKSLDPRQKFYYARELYYNYEYDLAINIFNEFLSEGRGWIENNINACQHLYYCYNAVGDNENAFLSLLRSFSYDIPRSEICCDIGNHFLDLTKYIEAIFWYKQATNSKKNDKSGGFYLPECYGYIPFMQICVCYDKLGDYKRAYYYNEKAGKLKPDSSGYLLNKEYFDKII